MDLNKYKSILKICEIIKNYYLKYLIGLDGG